MLKRNNNFKQTPIKVVGLDVCLAKTIILDLKKEPGVSVSTHCLVVGHVARELIRRIPAWLRKTLFPDGSELIAAAHDIGKISPTFQEKIYRDVGTTLGIISPELDKEIGGHSAVSQATVTLGLKYIPEILGRHHGYTPQGVNLSDSEVYGGRDWQKQRIDLLNLLKEEFKTDWPMVSSALHSDVLAGLTTVADWIGSGPLFDVVEHQSWRSNILEAVSRAGFVTPKIVKGLTFSDVFDFSPRSIQMQLVEAIKIQGTYVLEAPMGIGKTEAALYAAYKILEKGEATGIYFALPTRLTSDKIYDRMNHYLQKILDKDDINRRPLLLHSSAWLRDTELGEDGAPGHSWFNSAKRGLLAPFAVGTIDQALMAVMNVKHGFVRTFGLAGKIVILDEVHSYDSYTGTLLKELANALRELHCTVIILSATLTDKQRHSMLGVSFDDKDRNQVPTPYPLISVYPKTGVLQELSAEKIKDIVVNIGILHNDEKVVDEALIRAERGEQILWIENTVDDAQKRYRLLAAKAQGIGVDCGLLHSRFLKADRKKNEDKWVSVFGKAGRNHRHEKGRILVGTQVLEQSLDIDADFLITRICPTDMLFQRLGRLWRHRENDTIRSDKATCEAWILAPSLADAIQNPANLGKSAKVYSPYILCRTLEVWQNISSVKLPETMRFLLEDTYKERTEEGNMANYKKETEAKRDKLCRMALVGVSRGGKTLPESKATTRYSETESVEVLLIKNNRKVDNGMVLRLVDDSELLLPQYVDMQTRRQIAAELLRNTVTVPVYLAPVALTKQIAWLGDYIYLGDAKESPFRVALVLDSDDLQGIGSSDISEKYNLSYDACLGYRAEKRKGVTDDNDGE